MDQDAFVSRHNIAPRSFAPVIRRRGVAPDGTSEHPADIVIHTMKWGTFLPCQLFSNSVLCAIRSSGVVPHWSKHEDTTLSTTNARSENLLENRGMWTSLKGRKRCAVICEGSACAFCYFELYSQRALVRRYYEWLKKGKDKIPHFTKQKTGKLMLLAGLYDSVVLQGNHYSWLRVISLEIRP